MEDFDVKDPMADSHAMANSEVINNSTPRIQVSGAQRYDISF